MKKVLSLVLALLMTASTASAVLADDVVAIAEEPVAVEEVAEEVEAGQYDKAIEFLANYKIFKGYNADDTGAEDLIQRYQMALFVARIATGWVEDEVWEDGPENWSEFSDIDVEPVNKYYGALSFANQKGIIEGYGNGKFGPTDSITYQNALTMVVRTLGYTGLDWPWGYIQKAVELGLTDGITGVAYTDELTRGEVAQIIYNALFAKTKDGANLALKNFGIEFGWEKVVITASNINTFEKLAEDKGTGVEKELVAFKLLNDDGTLADDTYKALAADFDLDYTKHEDDLAVGNAYYVLFEKDAKSDLVDVVAVESLLVDVIENAGKTDDEGEEQEYAIQEFLADYTLVNKYTTNEYLNVTASLKPELLVWDVVGGITEDVVNGYDIAIDWNEGHILGYEYKDGKPVDQNGDEKITKEDYVVQWYYNTLLDRYYEEKYNKDGEFIGINYMSDEEFEKFYESTVSKVKTSFKGFTAITSIAKTAYATLEVFDTNLDGVADRALYESYKLGKFENSTIRCCDADRASYKLSSVNTLAVNAAKDGNDKEDVSIATFHQLVEGVCDHGKAWFVEGYTPVVAYDEDGEEAGYEAGYVIYSADAETGAIKVVKNINDGSDEDTYVATGVLRAYNVNKETVTIDDTQFTMNYDELAGTGFYLVNKNSATKAAYTATLRALFNQFVEYIVVDGEVVHVRAKTASTSKLFVVDSYAGLSNDGYIVVNGYFTDSLEYTQIRVATYNNWFGGDYFYYLDEDKAAESFTKGAMYAISSYDKEEDAYFVQLAGSFEDGKYIVDTKYVNKNAATIAEDADGYAIVTIADETKTRKMKSSDKYVIVLENPEERPYAPVIVYEGKLAEGWTIEGTIINTTDENAGTYVIVNAKVNGFADTYKTGFALLLKDTYHAAGYNGTDAEDWYLLGASAYEVEAFDLLNGDADAVYYATNKNLKVGHVYFTQENVLVEDKGINTLAEIMDKAEDAYGEDSIETGKYWFGNAVITEDTYADLFTGDKDLDEKFVFANTDIEDFAGVSKFYDDVIDGFAVFGVEYDKKGEVITSISGLSKDAFKKLVKDYEEYAFNVYFVYNATTTNIVAYVDITEAAKTVELVEGKTDAITVWEDNTYDAEIEAVIDYTAKYVNDELVGITVDGVTLTFAGDAVDTFDHANIDALNFHFGQKGACDLEAVLAYVKVQLADTTMLDLEVVGESLVETTYENHDDEAECNLVKSIYVPVVAEDGENFVAVETVFAPDVVVSFDLTADLENAGWYDLDESVDFEITFDDEKVIVKD